ncbi:cytochrome P450 [Polyangium mundeleinium]|uniref:Cytochrome P450 n=1 Tax=Polyangium mundeleinium TaxID=2995306 RepID=A0ABT5ER46_9BACT|nr:cytochrome P450 [Polyangium mundeleinium]MDC0743934.1 cytochrome P450 [Polyangium mundeleinium]
MATFPKGPTNNFLVNVQGIMDPIGYTLRLRERYGDPMSLPKMDGKPGLATGSVEGLRSVFAVPPEALDQMLAKNFSALFGESSLFVLSGARHTAMRKLLMPPFHGQRMRLYGKQICDLALQHSRDFKPGQQLVAQDLMHTISLQTIIHIVFGVTAPEEAARLEKLLESLRKSLSLGLTVTLVIPWLRREFGGFGPWAHWQRVTQDLRSFLDPELARRRADPAERTDILSLLLKARQEDGTELNDQQIFEQLHTLLFAGHSTTAGALSWALSFLGHAPAVLRRLQDELTALGADPEPEALAKAPYLEAVCNETLRLRPPSPGVGRKLNTPMRIAGYDLPAGAGVFAQIIWAHHDPAVFPESEVFRPERFLERTYSPFEFLPFGGGNRRCIGAAFALYEMKLVLGTLLRRYSFELVSRSQCGWGCRVCPALRCA